MTITQIHYAVLKDNVGPFVWYETDKTELNLRVSRETARFPEVEHLISGTISLDQIEIVTKFVDQSDRQKPFDVQALERKLLGQE